MDRILKVLGQLAIIIVLALFCLLLCCPPAHRPIFQESLKDYNVHYGLDLEGGSELLYQIDPRNIDPTRNVEDVIDETIGVISQRIFESNIVKDPRIQKQGEQKILIQLPGLNQIETDMIKKEIETLGNLEFRLVASKKIGKEIVEEKERIKYNRAKKAGPRRFAYYQRRLANKGYRWFLPRDIKTQKARLLWVRDGYDFAGKKFRKFALGYSEARRAITFELKDEFKSYFGSFTEKYKGELLAIVFNNKFVAAPVISNRINGYGVMVGFKVSELKKLMKVLRSGSLEIQPELLNENTIGPSLGEDAIRLGISAGLIGLALVVVFMIIYYLGAGLIANIALFLNIIIIGAVLVIWGETLTLPGIAGIILTMGMSVDANIIIFERIKEEKHKRNELLRLEKEGKKKKNKGADLPVTTEEAYSKEELLDVLSKGYGRAFRAILDANVTTLITAVILYYLGSGTVQGFAFTLGVGIIASFFTAIVVTKLIFICMIETRVMKKIVMQEWVKTPKFKFSRKMRLAAIASVIIIGMVISVFFARGESNYGLDLKGGILAQISLEKPLTSQQVRDRLKKKFQVEVQHIERTENLLDVKDTTTGYYDFSVRLPNLHQKEIDDIKKKLEVIAGQMRKKNSALKEINSMIIRSEESYRIAKREYIKEKNNSKASEQDIKDAKEYMKKCKDTVADTRKNVGNLNNEVDELKQKRAALMKEKNRLAGIEELRKEIELQFKEEISPLPFGRMKKGEGRFSIYHVLPVRMNTPLPEEYLLKNLQTQTLFREVHVAVTEFAINVKSKEKPADAQATFATLIKKHLHLTSRIAASEIVVSKSAKDGEYDIIAKFAKAAPKVAVKNAMEKCGWESFSIELRDNGRKYLKHFELFLLLPSEMLVQTAVENQKQVEEKVRASFDNKQYQGITVYFSNPFPRFTQISGLVARAQKAKAYQAIVLALLLILIYIAFRFSYNGFVFAGGAVIALAHDVLFTLGIIALFAQLGIVNVEINLPVIAALLTIVGYSLNDTIVIFDRIRENQEKHGKDLWDRLSQDKIAGEFDDSLNQTLSRTLFTSLTTLLVLAVIFVLNFGKGSVMEGFSFTLLVGVLVGTYSSVFVASSFVLRSEKKGRIS